MAFSDLPGAHMQKEARTEITLVCFNRLSLWHSLIISPGETKAGYKPNQ